MNATVHRNSPPPATRGASTRDTAARSAWWVLGTPALALAATLMLFAAGARSDWIGALWLAAVLWTVAASLVQSVWAGLRHGDWSAFVCSDPSCPALRRDDPDHDFATRSGLYAHLRIRDRHKSLMREGDRFLEDHDRTASLS